MRPDRILLSYATNDVLRPTVTWRTHLGHLNSRLELATVGPKVDFYEKPIVVEASSESIATIDEEVLYYRADLPKLQANQQYAYRVGNGVYWSEWIQFDIPNPKIDQPIKFIYLGDAQNDLFPLWSRVVRQAYAKAPDAHFMLHAGDMINHSQNNYEWGEWFAATSFISKEIPQFVVAGNHEYIKDSEGKKTGLTPLFDVQFNQPNNGLEHLRETNYYFDQGNFRLIVLNSNQSIEEQAIWLEELLSNTSKKWVVVSFHHPVVSAAQGRMNEGILKHWKPIMDKYKVDMVLQGHDHTYGRGNNVQSGLGEWDEDSGTVYVVSVSGRKMYGISDHIWMQKKAENIQTYQVISIDGDELIYESFTTDGKLFDGFTLKKRSNNRKNKFKTLGPN